MQNQMPIYLGTANIDAPYNAILLRADLHVAFDIPKFAFFPKPGHGEARQFAVHFVQQSVELGPLYHNRGLHSILASSELLFARFAWTIFPSLAEFLLCGSTRYLQLRTSKEDDERTRISPVSSVECRKFVERFLWSPDSSPQKRQRTGGNEEDDEDSYTTISSSMDAASTESSGTSLIIGDEDSPCRLR